VSLGAGYVTFFFYSVAIGVVAVALAFIVARRQPEIEALANARAAEAPTGARTS